MLVTGSVMSLELYNNKCLFFHLLDNKNFTIILGPQWVTASHTEYHLPRTSIEVHGTMYASQYEQAYKGFP